MFQQYRSTTAFINLQFLSSNLRSLKKLVGQSTFFCPMVKANAYGHGDAIVAKHLEKENVNVMGVGLIEEGVLLRDQGVQAELIFFGVFDTTHAARAVVDHKLTPVLSTWEQISLLENILENPISVHVKFDTGMHRLGFSIAELDRVHAHLSSHPKIKVAGILTHLHSAEDADNIHGQSFQQLRAFQSVVEKFRNLNPIVHTLNSAGALNFAKHKNSTLPDGISSVQGVRPGLALYGYSPIENPPIALLPTMSLRSKTVKYHYIKAGDSVSYGANWKAGRDSVVAVVPIGYADGYHRLLSNHAEVLFRGQKAPVVGNVCMDYFMIDVTDTLKSEVASSLAAEEVTLFGFDSLNNSISAAVVAGNAKTITWEILTSIDERVPRNYRQGGFL